MSTSETVFSATKDGSIKVERVFAGVVVERFIVGPKRECPKFKDQTFEKFPEWKKLAIAYLQTERSNNPIFFHVEGYIYGELNIELPVNTPEAKTGWYYWDETWAYYHGPFPSYDLAQADLVAYCKWLNTPKVTTAPSPQTITCPESVGQVSREKIKTVSIDQATLKVEANPACAICGAATIELGTAKDVLVTYPNGNSVVMPDGKVSYCSSCTHHPISEYLT